MTEKKILVTKAFLPSIEEYIDEIKDLWLTHWITNMGEKHEKFRAALKEYMRVHNLELFTNGHMALELSLQALNLQGEVITTPYTFASTIHAIIRNGLEPVFCDINPDDFTIDVEKIEELITDRTCAILPVHVYGNICNVDEIDRLAQKYGLKVIYDAAHAFGEEYKGKSVGEFGDISCFSFHATKVFNSIEGGAATFRDQEYGLSLYRLKNFGIRGPERVDAIGANAKMNEFCAAMGLCNLRHIEYVIKKRKQVSERYWENLQNIEGIKLNYPQFAVNVNYSYFPIVIDEKVFGSSRNEVFAALGKEGIMTRKYFYPLTNSYECFHGTYNVDNTPIARHIANRVLTLPLYPELEMGDVDRICKIMLKCKV